MRPLRGLQETRVATREESGVLGCGRCTGVAVPLRVVPSYLASVELGVTCILYPDPGATFLREQGLPVWPRRMNGDLVSGPRWSWEPQHRAFHEQPRNRGSIERDWWPAGLADAWHRWNNISAPPASASAGVGWGLLEASFRGETQRVVLFRAYRRGGKGRWPCRDGCPCPSTVATAREGVNGCELTDGCFPP